MEQISEKTIIMVVDDDESTRTIIRTILQTSGFEVVSCEGGMEAIATLQEIKPKLVVLDIMMPEMSGYEVMVRMKQSPQTQDIPVIFLTAKSDPEDLLVGYKDYGVEYYITKPFTAQQLLAGVKLILTASEES